MRPPQSRDHGSAWKNSLVLDWGEAVTRTEMSSGGPFLGVHTRLGPQATCRRGLLPCLPSQCRHDPGLGRSRTGKRTGNGCLGGRARQEARPSASDTLKVQTEPLRQGSTDASWPWDRVLFPYRGIQGCLALGQPTFPAPSPSTCPMDVVVPPDRLPGTPHT